MTDAEIKNDIRDQLTSFLESYLANSFFCTRAWDAWDEGTMSEDDFEEIEDHDIKNIIDGIVHVIFEVQDDMAG